MIFEEILYEMSINVLEVEWETYVEEIFLTTTRLEKIWLEKTER